MNTEQTVEEKAKPASAAASDPGVLGGIVVPVLAAVGTGIGALGFVIFFGGFVLWTRFDAVGLPANEAVAQVPRSDLVATGASFLVPAFLAAFAAAALALAGRDAMVGRRRRNRRRKAAAKQSQAVALLESLENQVKRVELEVERLDGDLRRQDAAPALREIGQAGDEARNVRAGTAAQLEVRRTWLVQAREELVPQAIQDVEAAGRDVGALCEHSKTERVEQTAIGCVVMLGVEIFVIGAGLGGLPLNEALLVLGACLLSVVIAIVVVSITDSFALLVLCAFLGVGVAIAFSTYARTHTRPKVSPFAAMDNSVPVSGFFVAETADAIYFGRPEPAPPGSHDAFAHRRITLLWLPKKELSDLTVGPIMDETDAYKRGLVLAMALCRRPPPPQPTGTSRPFCKPTTLADLEQRLAQAKALN